MSWNLDGEYFENCSCEILCPCITNSMQGPADYERCQVPLIMHIDKGEKDGVSLDGLNAILLIDSPQVMGEGGWRVGWPKEPPSTCCARILCARSWPEFRRRRRRQPGSRRATTVRRGPNAPTSSWRTVRARCWPKASA